MAEACIKHRIQFDFVIENVSKLTKVYSDVFKIRGILWKFGFEKIAACQDNGMKDMIECFLTCDFPTHLKEFKCVAGKKVELLTNDDSKKTKEFFEYAVHDVQHNCNNADFIEWDQLFQDGYVQNDTAVFEIELIIGPLKRRESDNVYFETTSYKYENRQVTEKSLDLTLSNISDFWPTETKRFIFSGSPWIIYLDKRQENNQDTLIIELINLDEQLSNDWSCEATSNLILLSVNSDFMPIEQCSYLNFSKTEISRLLFKMDWCELDERFVENNAIKMIVDLKVGKCSDNVPINSTRFIPIEKNRIFVECVICMENMIDNVISETPCGHSFCKGCIEQAITTKKSCPVCNSAVEVQELHRSYIPKYVLCCRRSFRHIFLLINQSFLLFCSLRLTED